MAVIRVFIGEKHNHLTATGNYKLPLVSKNGRIHEWECDCGNKLYTRSAVVRSGETKTCGKDHCKYMLEVRHRLKEGHRFGHLILTGKHTTTVGKIKSKSEFKCDCGNIGYYDLRSVKSGDRINCCHTSCPYNRRIKHGYTMIENSEKYKKEYQAWRDIGQRCYNQNNKQYIHYGGRGITICDEFKSFETFFNYIGSAPSKEHSIDRINNNKGYEIGNIRWSTKSDQNRNKRKKEIVSKDNQIYYLKKKIEELQSAAINSLLL